MISRLVIFSSLWLFAAGCSKTSDKLPDLHPAKGSVTKNGAPASEGSIQFMPTDNRELIRVIGDVDGNGRFELFTVKNNARQKGAPAGTYTVAYTPSSTQQSVESKSITLTRTYTINPGENDLKIELVEKQ